MIEIDDDFIRDKTIFIPSFDCGSDKQDTALYFYHIGKTGGTTVWGFLRLLAYSLKVNLYHVPGKFGQHLKEPTTSDFRPSSYKIVAGHGLYGYHSFFENDFSLITLVREPVGRIISDYFWTFKDQDEGYLKDHKNFVAYLDNVARHNHQTSVLLGFDGGLEDPWHMPLGNDAPIELALERLTGFKYLATTSNSKNLLTIISSVNGGPTFWVEKGKVNPYTELKSEFRETYGEEILSRNQCDSQLVAYVESKDLDLMMALSELKLCPQREGKYMLADHDSRDESLASQKAYRVIDLKTKQAIQNPGV